MNLLEILDGIKYETKLKNLDNIQINNISADSRGVQSEDVFVCIDGARFNGHDYAKMSLQDGIRAVVVQRDIGLINQVIVEDTRNAYALMVSNYFGNPSSKLKLVGVTGTNGKTTTTYLLKHILESAGKKVGLIGTIQNEIGDMIFPAKYTTPDPLELHTLFKRMLDAGCEYVVMETSSHALEQGRLYGCRFECGVFTNLTQDHLDYHLTMENYWKAKRKLFDASKIAVINVDDDSGRRMFQDINCQKYSYSLYSGDANFYAKDIKNSPSGVNFKFVCNSSDLREEYDISLEMIGNFSVANSVAAASVATELGITIEDILSGLENCRGVKGRGEIIFVNDELTVIRDYAHGPDGIDKILDAINQFAKGRVVILFGCAGNRDRTKRKIMTEIAVKKSDFVILTSDNPRDEDPEVIISDAKEGLGTDDTKYKIIVDRYEAIEWAINNSQKGDILVLAGKGHEDYQVLDFGTVYFDEYEIVKEIMERKSIDEARER